MDRNYVKLGKSSDLTEYEHLENTITYIQGGGRHVVPLIVHITLILLLQKHLKSRTELILIGWKIVPNESL